MGRRQGSSVDAAIATILCQCVENSHSCGVGGGHFMTVYKRFVANAFLQALNWRIYYTLQLSYFLINCLH